VSPPIFSFSALLEQQARGILRQEFDDLIVGNLPKVGVVKPDRAEHLMVFKANDVVG
jgi:hypothetical protein